MSDEQDVLTPGWVDPRGARATETGAAPAGATAVVPGQRTEAPPATPAPAAAGAPGPNPDPEPQPVGEPTAAATPEAAPAPGPDAEPGAAPHPTAPVGGRPQPRLPRLPRRDPMIRMGPWAPVAGAAVGLLLGIVVVLLLAPAVESFDQRLALVFVVLGLSLLGAGGTLLADEVRIMRRGAQAAEARAAGAGVIAGLLNGLTPARLLIAASAFVLLLSAYVTQGS
ncbi:conserved membrane protein of unknown function [Modestobacter italicus]|uniref:Uncharacterized protein n=1 Tax=Modestobacter italicus (strain DSM 44449 / CECT 9708 / BC 501) TaxID=2732864 RepID=I4EZ62_MODI5|nr:hypothetical protein [Modestobacter marinus]CCH88675.1 conserved membrane protein of unknown function [Modestobacter marinus]